MLVRFTLLAMVVAMTAACPATTSSSLAEANAASATPTLAGLGAMTIEQATLYRDGGTIVVKGKLADGTDIRVRMDGAMGSETRGLFFVTQGDAKERRLTRPEATQVLTAVDTAVQAPGSTLDTRVTDIFQAKLKDFEAGKEPIVQ